MILNNLERKENFNSSTLDEFLFGLQRLLNNYTNKHACFVMTIIAVITFVHLFCTNNEKDSN
ncbi:hypothetical protein BLOT_000984 [Blomia tropicalis]|nr:hypothetical protein BLOT_000984 [Blomia tropicalis]